MCFFSLQDWTNEPCLLSWDCTAHSHISLLFCILCPILFPSRYTHNMIIISCCSCLMLASFHLVLVFWYLHFLCGLLLLTRLLIVKLLEVFLEMQVFFCLMKGQTVLWKKNNWAAESWERLARSCKWILFAVGYKILPKLWVQENWKNKPRWMVATAISILVWGRGQGHS